ncbi:hypothetical protein, partial [Thiohalocapsa halophila]
MSGPGPAQDTPAASAAEPAAEGAAGAGRCASMAATLGSPALRVLTVGLLLFGGMFLAATTPLGPVASSVAMVLAM